MINNLLDLSRIESHEFVVVRRLIDVRGLIDELIDGAQPMADRKRISLRVQGLDGFISAIFVCIYEMLPF